MAFLSAKMLFRLEIKVGAAKVRPCSKEFENRLLHLQGMEDSRLRVSFPLSMMGVNNNARSPLSGSTETLKDPGWEIPQQLW